MKADAQVLTSAGSASSTGSARGTSSAAITTTTTATARCGCSNASSSCNTHAYCGGSANATQYASFGGQRCTRGSIYGAFFNNWCV